VRAAVARLAFAEDKSLQMLVLGAGLQGSACAYDLLQNPAVQKVIVADINVDRLPPFLERYRNDPRLELLALDAHDEQAVLAAMGRAQACMNALPYYFNLKMARLAVRSGVHYSDLGGNTEIVFQQLELDDEARAKGVRVVPDCGLAPGMVNILAAAGIGALDKTDAVRIYVGGLPQDPQPPLNYQVVYSLHGVLDYYTTLSWVVRNGERVQVEALSEIEPIDFPAPAGTLEAFHTAGGLSVMPWTYEGKIPTMEYKTLRYPGHAEIMRAIRGLGLLDLEPIEVGKQQVVPRDLFIAAVEPRLKRPEGRDLVALRVEVEGTRGGEAHRVTYDLLDFFDEENDISAMERTTGYSLSITGQMQVAGTIAMTGAQTPDQCVPAEEYIRELGRRGVEIRRREV
jgi:lysine 6-dehydrogenase